jgi:hypothetical protein
VGISARGLNIYFLVAIWGYQLSVNQRKAMKEKFDELAKGLAQSVTRRAAVKKFGLGLAGALLACLGLTNKAEGV